MAIQQTKKQSDLEKRLRLLRQQVYGKHVEATTTQTTSTPSSYNFQAKKTESRIDFQIASTDINYLYQDLLKIFTLASLALAIQIVLFFLLKQSILNFNFF